MTDSLKLFDTVQIDGEGTLTLDEHPSSPATPDANKVVLYAKTDKFLYSKDDAGVETQLGGGGGGVSEPANQVVYGTGGGTTSSSTFTYTSTGNIVKVGDPTTPAPTNDQVLIAAAAGQSMVQLTSPGGSGYSYIILKTDTLNFEVSADDANNWVQLQAVSPQLEIVNGEVAGQIDVRAGNAASGTNSGGLYMYAGELSGSTPSPVAGYVEIYGGTYSGTETSNVEAGQVYIQGGQTPWSDAPAFIVLGGAYSDSGGVQYGGFCSINAGNVTTGSNANGGSMDIFPGLGDGTGADGVVRLHIVSTSVSPHSWQPGLTMAEDEIIVGRPMVNNSGNAQILTTTDMRYTGCPVAPTMNGAPTGNAVDGTMVLDEANNRLYVMVAGTWRYTTLT